MAIATARKITKANFKKFVKMWRDTGKLLIRTESKFNGMTDGVESVNDTFSVALNATRWNWNANPPVEEWTGEDCSYTLGIAGIWLVGGGRDSFSLHCENGIIGIHVYNSCGSFTVGVKFE